MYEKLRSRKRVKKITLEYEGEVFEFYIKKLSYKDIVDAHFKQEEKEGSERTLTTSVYLIVRSLCDAEGNPVFKNDEEGIAEVMEWDIAILNKLTPEIIAYNNLEGTNPLSPGQND